jgi:hypothetical protein
MVCICARIQCVAIVIPRINFATPLWRHGAGYNLTSALLTVGVPVLVGYSLIIVLLNFCCTHGRFDQSVDYPSGARSAV